MDIIQQNYLNTINASKKEIVIIPGLGGHSSASFAPLLKKINKNFVIAFNGFDDGGDTGKVTAALGTPAMGDFRNFLTHLLQADLNKDANGFKALSELLQKRFSTFEELKLNAKESISLLNKLMHGELDDLDIENYVDIFEDACKRIDHEYLYDGEDLIKHSVGNIVLSALFKHFGGFNEMVYQLKNWMILDKNIFPVSMSDSKVELFGEDIYGNEVRREKNIDVHPHPIPLNKIKCVYPDTTITFTEKNEFLSEVMLNAKLFIWPPSSPNNYSVITSIYENEINSALNNGANGICWMPITREGNTLGVADIMLLLGEKFQGKINFIFAKSPSELIDSNPREYLEITKAYIREGKQTQFAEKGSITQELISIAHQYYPHLSDEEFGNLFADLIKHIFPSNCVNVRYFHPSPEMMFDLELPLEPSVNSDHAKLALENVNRGFKHNPDFMFKFIEMVINNDWQVSQELVEEVEKLVSNEFKALKNGETLGLIELLRERTLKLNAIPNESNETFENTPEPIASVK